MYIYEKQRNYRQDFPSYHQSFFKKVFKFCLFMTFRLKYRKGKGYITKGI